MPLLPPRTLPLLGDNDAAADDDAADDAAVVPPWLRGGDFAEVGDMTPLLPAVCFFRAVGIDIVIWFDHE